MSRMRKILTTIIVLLAFTHPAMADTKYVNSRDGLRVRAEPGTDGEVLEVVPFGTALVLADDGDYGNWYMVWHGDRTAYVCKDYLQEDNPLHDMDYKGKWRITAYAYTGSACANGNYPQTGYTVACNYLPFGTEVYIEGVGFRTVEDRGPAWLGDEWCDLYLGDTSECIRWGDQYRGVWVAGKEKSK